MEIVADGMLCRKYCGITVSTCTVCGIYNMVMHMLKFDNQALMATTSVLFESDYTNL